LSGFTRITEKASLLSPYNLKIHRNEKLRCIITVPKHLPFFQHSNNCRNAARKDECFFPIVRFRQKKTLAISNFKNNNWAPELDSDSL
jgi:hypothetical protein